MTILLWITGILTILYLGMTAYSKFKPAQSGDDYIGKVFQTVVGLFAAVSAVVTFLVWV